MGLTATGRRSISRLGIDPLSIAGPLAVVFGWDIDAMPVACHLLHRERGLADSAGHTRSWSRSPATAAGSGRPHDVRKGIIRRQGGRLPRCSIQRVRMGLRATDGAGGCGRLPDTSSPATKTARGIPRTSHCMFMAGQLLDREGRGSHSAGHTRSWSRSPATAAGLGGPHDVLKGIVRRQATGSLGTGTRQAVRVGLGAARGIGRLFAGAVAGGFRVRPVSPLAEFMRMARHLLHGESRGLDSAGQAGRRPPQTTPAAELGDPHDE